MADEFKQIRVKAQQITGGTQNTDVTVDLGHEDLNVTVTGDPLDTGIASPHLNVNITNLGENRQASNHLFHFAPDFSTSSDYIEYKIIGKNLSDSSSTLDSLGFEINSVSEDIGGLSDTDSKIVITERYDISLTAELVDRHLNKSSGDLSTTSDSNVFSINPNKTDQIITVEAVAHVFRKSLFDSVTSTDDALGISNIDDDQIAGVVNPEFDVSGVSDINYNHIFKALIDVVGTDDTDIDLRDGTIKDSSSLSDLLANALVKPFEDSSSASDAAPVFVASPLKLDIANSTDILTRVATYFRVFGDTATAASSGIVNKQNYFSEEYGTENYVGQNFSF
jgi:hypothetical protein